MRDTNLKVKEINYFKTNRGYVGYKATTDYGSILNDGDGGPTYFVGNTHEDQNSNLSEWDLEELLDVFEGKKKS